VATNDGLGVVAKRALEGADRITISTIAQRHCDVPRNTSSFRAGERGLAEGGYKRLFRVIKKIDEGRAQER